MWQTVTLQTGLLTSIWAAVDLTVYLTNVSADTVVKSSYSKCQLCLLTAHGTVGHFVRGIKNSDDMTVIYFLMCHSQSYTRTRYYQV